MKINFLFAPSIVIALSFGLTSCTWGPQKIPMTTSGSTSTPPPSAYNPVDTASIASSNQASAGVSIPEEAELRLRFKTLSAGYTSESDLVKSEQYKKFVTDIYTLFATYKAKPGNHEKELKYIFDQMIPYMVMDEWVKNNKSNEKKAELIVQSVKRKDFNALRDKELLTEKYKIYFEEQRFNPFVKTLTDERITLIKSSDTEFAKQFFDIQNGVVVSILSPRYDWNKTGIGYKPGELEAEFTTYLNAKFEKALLLLEVTPEVLEKKTFSYYAVDSLEWLGWLIKKDFTAIRAKYTLDGKIPMDREYRGDEQADIFKDRATVDAYIAKVSNDRGTEFESDIKNLRLKMYLLSYLGRKHPSDADQGLWSSRARAKFLDPVYGNAIQNLFRLSRYVNPELVTLDLNATFLK